MLHRRKKNPTPPLTSLLSTSVYVIDTRYQLPSSRTTRAGSAANIPTTNARRIEVSTLPSVLTSLETRLELVNKTVNDEIQLLIGSVQVRDSETFMKQAERATMLTLLAAVYLPLQLVTGIFRMYIAEINDGMPVWRACIVALAVAGGLTLVGLRVFGGGGRGGRR
jgi:hypothetical protein